MTRFFRAHRFAFALAVAGFSHGIAAQEIVGSGASSCAGWTEARKTSDHDLRLAWVNGYLSAIAVSSGREMLRKIEPAAIIASIDKYCAGHPADQLARAADQLSGELYRKAEPAARESGRTGKAENPLAPGKR
jgi:hypothetical protein